VEPREAAHSARGCPHILISVQAQRLYLFDPDPSQLDIGNPPLRSPRAEFVVSTSRNGTGQEQGSFRTPLGRHLVRAKIGKGAALNTVFVGRRPTGEVWTQELAASSPGRDWILTRILWLSGLEPGINRLGQVDTMRRYIYIHGSPPSVVMGEPGSIGCIRMRNQDIVDLFDLVPYGTTVDIQD
jgi:lipoprotein-anchoring transpeptidase ErfK/SrfK